MKYVFLIIILLSICKLSYSERFSYQPLNTADPIRFYGNYIIYNGQNITLGPKAFFIDGQLTDKEVAKYPYVFNSINEASKHLTSGTEKEPMVLYIAPYVYWIDNPDDPYVRKGTNGSIPYGLEIECEWLSFYGLTNDPRNVVLACNRGQTIGAIGNFTMLKLLGDGVSSENLTFGNYCNVDLIFPLKPELNRKKRASAIVQAQLIHCNGDKMVARNTRFISRLNLCNFAGAKRILFDNCHMECTDDALCGTGVYHNCTFDFHSSKPFYKTTGTGAVFLNCDIKCFSDGEQHFTKSNGQLSTIDTRFEAHKSKYISWNDVTPTETRNYQSNVQFKGYPYLIGKKSKESTIDITRKLLLNAYKVASFDTVMYNVYNLLKGDDDWDPMHNKETIKAIEKEHWVKLVDLPVQLKIVPTRSTIETGKDTLILTASAFRFGNYPASLPKIKWHLENTDSNLVKLIPSPLGGYCKVIPTNINNDTEEITVVASTKSGLEAASVLYISPEKLEAPEFITLPEIKRPQDGEIKVNYKLDMPFADKSFVSWYRCTDKHGSSPVKVGVSRLGKPYKNYELTTADIGYFMMAEVFPKHLRCEVGTPKYYTFNKPIKARHIKSPNNILKTNFINVAVENQLRIKPGFWTFSPLETTRNGQVIPADTTKNAWYYGEGSQGHANMNGLLQSGRSGVMLYTPEKKDYGDMTIELIVSPYKTAGQGFSIASLYMDILIKFDNKTMSGYGLRFQRTTKYGNAVDCYFIKYENGKAIQISDNITTNCYRTPCKIALHIKGDKMSAKASTKGDFSNPIYPEILPEVNLSTTIEETTQGGVGIIYNGGSTTMINHFKVLWQYHK